MAGGSTTTTTIVPTSTTTTTIVPTSTTSTTTKLIGAAGQMKLQIQEYGKTREITVFNPGQNIISLETVSESTDVFISIRERAPIMISFPSRFELDAFAAALNSSIINGVTPFTLSNIRTGALITTTTTAAPTSPTSTSTTSTTTVAGSTTTTTTIISPSIQWNFTKAEGTSATFKLYKSTDGGSNFTVVETRYGTDSGTYYSIVVGDLIRVQVITTADRNGVAEIRSGSTVLATSSGLGSQITSNITVALGNAYTATATAGL